MPKRESVKMKYWCFDTEPEKLEAFYREIIPVITKVSRRYGYAIAVHGSLRRDLDIIAVPWVDNAKPSEKLRKAILRALGGLPASQGWQQKPDGRSSIAILVGRVAYIDLAVVPFIPTPSPSPLGGHAKPLPHRE